MGQLLPCQDRQGRLTEAPAWLQQRSAPSAFQDRSAGCLMSMPFSLSRSLTGNPASAQVNFLTKPLPALTVPPRRLPHVVTCSRQAADGQHLAGAPSIRQSDLTKACRMQWQRPSLAAVACQSTGRPLSGNLQRGRLPMTARTSIRLASCLGHV